jgi:hypothetical protein
VLVSNWSDILMKAWSVRLMFAAAAVDGIAVAWPEIMGAMGLTPVQTVLISIALSGAAIWARVIDQGIAAAKAAEDAAAAEPKVNG